ncbi:hypothetical protein K9N68_12430 [Kovacikia minuta CCNUW1]|uniref:slr1601 family putative cell division protein n=1 Tax=Kovacikia minuta TaxID=2931930 RepID=UPI001CCBEE3D|nr:hypothetical protein [Kovacikia minuta]UBF28607.1 hypothetical protein K9N68_12430 [Kovacikia minuta CCNUW1]
MYALKSPQPDLKPTRRAHRASRAHVRHRKNPYQEIAIETSIKLTVNLLLSVVAVIALTKLLSYKVTQEAKLQELNVAVKTTEGRVQVVRSNFKQYFDSNQASTLMQQQTNRIDPSQRQIIWKLPGKGERPNQ